MEPSDQHGFLEELLALRRESWDAIPTEASQFFSNGGCRTFDHYYFDQNSATFFPENSCRQENPQSYSGGSSSNNNYAFDEFYNSLVDEIYSAPHSLESSSYNTVDTTSLDTPPFLGDDFSFCMAADEEDPGFLGEDFHRSLNLQSACKMGPVIRRYSPEGSAGVGAEAAAAFSVGTCLDRKNRSKKIQGQPSKNLMAERRRRKRLNDRLSMLRSIVPKISKVINNF